VRRLQRAELLDHEEPQNDTGSNREEEVLQPVPQAHAAQRSEVAGCQQPVASIRDSV
jgi:hypothetical protein